MRGHRCLKCWSVPMSKGDAVNYGSDRNSGRAHARRVSLGVAAGALVASSVSMAQSLSASTCNAGTDNPPACNPGVVRGDRAEGWLGQGRSEVMARNGMVTTSQPLAAQAGLEILKQGGNAIDAAGANARTVKLGEPV